tara:strand:+ start:263 stop:1189 length:927 start_codon:yes stop_codon:yes gene_type:complete
MKKDNSTLIAELGGTNARLGLTKNGSNIAQSKKYFLSDFTSVEALFCKYFEEINQVVFKGIIGVAAPVIEDEIRFTNNDIKFNQKTLKNKMFPKGLLVLNDLELQAYAIEGLSSEEIILIGQVKGEKKGSKVLISPGTGLGLAGIVDTKVIFTEGGHLNIPPDSLELEDLLKKFRQNKARPPTFEDFLSGKGINFIFHSLDGSSNTQYSNEEILTNTDNPVCVKTRKLILYLLAIYCKYIALIWGATSGVFLSGSIANTLLKPEDLDTFRTYFESSATMKDLLKTMPVYLIKDVNLGLKGGLLLASES